MACGNNIGLNEIFLEPGSSKLSNLKFLTSSLMEAQSRQSRIPKFGFGFKKVVSGGNGNDKTHKSSSFVSRSKSMRVNKTQLTPSKISHSNSIDNGESETINKTDSDLLHPALVKKPAGSKSNPNSRCNSPHGMKESSGSYCGGITDSTSSNDSTRVQVSHLSSNTKSTYVRGHTRSNSYGSKDKFSVNRVSTSNARRATVNTRPTVNKERSPQLLKQAASGSNLRKPKQVSQDYTDGNGQSSTTGSHQHNGDGIEQRRNSISSQGRSRRPFSFHEGSPDLNQLASELSQYEEDGNSTVSSTQSNPRIVKQG